MSIGFGKSYQYAGINRAGKYREAAREKGPADRNVCTTIEKPNEVWRRVTGIFPHVALSPKERRAGLTKLVEWIEKCVASHQTLRHEDAKARRNSDSESSGLGGFGVEVGAQGAGAR